MRLSPKQRQIALFGASPHRWTIASGPVGSGKTHSGLLGFGLWQRNYGQHEFGLLTKGHPQLASLLRDLERIYGLDLKIDSDGVVHLPGAGGTLNKLICFVGNDKRAEPRLRSFNLTGFLIDEATTLPFSLLAAANARCRVGDPKILALTNPDGPRHPLKVHYMDKAHKMDAQVIMTALRDNPVITQAYIDSLHRSYSGHMLERMVEGRWAAASGLVYPHYLEVCGEPDEEFVVLDVSVDVGESSVTHALLYGRTATGKTWVIDECRHHHIEQGVLSEREMVGKIRRRFAHHFNSGDSWGGAHSWVVDPSAKRFRQEMIAQGLVNVGKAYADFEPGVQEVNHWIATRALRIWSDRVPHLMDELGALVWDEDQAEKGNDVPAPTSDHGTDTLRHYVFTRMIHEIGGRKAWEIQERRRLETKL